MPKTSNSAQWSRKTSYPLSNYNHCNWRPLLRHFPHRPTITHLLPPKLRVCPHLTVFHQHPPPTTQKTAQDSKCQCVQNKTSSRTTNKSADNHSNTSTSFSDGPVSCRGLQSSTTTKIPSASSDANIRPTTATLHETVQSVGLLSLCWMLDAKWKHGACLEDRYSRILTVSSFVCFNCSINCVSTLYRPHWTNNSECVN